MPSLSRNQVEMQSVIHVPPRRRKPKTQTHSTSEVLDCSRCCGGLVLAIQSLSTGGIPGLDSWEPTVAVFATS